VPRLTEAYKPLSQEITELKDLKVQADNLTLAIDDLQKQKKVSEFFQAFYQSESIKSSFERLRYLAALSDDFLFSNYHTLWSMPQRPMASLSEQDKTSI